MKIGRGVVCHNSHRRTHSKRKYCRGHPKSSVDAFVDRPGQAKSFVLPVCEPDAVPIPSVLYLFVLDENTQEDSRRHDLRALPFDQPLRHTLNSHDDRKEQRQGESDPSITRSKISGIDCH